MTLCLIRGFVPTNKRGATQELPIVGGNLDNRTSASIREKREQPEAAILSERSVNLTGLQCPGPIVRLSQELEVMAAWARP